MCTQCVANDEKGNNVNADGGGKTECNWETGRYEISFLAGQIRVDCASNKGKCGTNLCKVSCENCLTVWEMRDLVRRTIGMGNGRESRSFPKQTFVPARI